MKTINFESWILEAMEEHGYMDTGESCIQDVARYLSQSPKDVIGTAEFRRACTACNVDPNSITQEDVRKIRKLLE